jgi:cyclohexanone monooxygenase
MNAINKACTPTKTPHDLDIPALRVKYRQERDKRLRTEAWKQYVDVAKEHQELYVTDPHTPIVPRAPIAEDIDVAILGAGFSGLLCAARLKERGVTNVRNIDLAGGFGGVWYWNRYPGVQCDNDSYCYLPLLEETGYVPTRKYVYGPEIREHCERIGKHFDLYKSALFGTRIEALRWDEKIKRWHVLTDRGDDIRARFVIMGGGSHSKLKLPGIPGIETFKGHTFHTQHWDYDYTGGDTTGGLTKLADKRVAIIGTGATAIQAVPHLGEHAKHLYVFQRTPSTVDDRGNSLTDQEWAKSLKPGWQEERRRSFQHAAIDGLVAPADDLVCDGWGEVNRNMAARMIEMGRPQLPLEKFMELREEEDYGVMERLRRRVDSIIKDKRTAELLKAWYRFGCKRPCYHDDYLPTFNRPNVTLIDVSETKGVERITEKGIVAGGVEHEVDCIVYASGFELTADIKRSWGISAIEGRGGKSLYDHWANGFRTFHGMTSNGFPNQFFTGFTQGAFAANVTAMYDQQATHISYMIKETIARGAVTAEASPEAQDGWVQTIRASAVPDREFWRECTPGYYNGEGDEVKRGPFAESYGPGFYPMERILSTWRDNGTMEGLVLEK